MAFKLNKRIVDLCESQIPGFVKENYEDFAIFLKAYFEFLETKTNAFYESQALLSYGDIDKTEEQFIQYFNKEFLPHMPVTTLAERKRLLKNIKQFYKTRGNEYSYRLLFRILFMNEIGFYYPTVDILKPDSGMWMEEKSIRTYVPENSEAFDVLKTYTGKVVRGIWSGATAIVDHIIDYTTPSGIIYELIFQKRSLVREFDPFEKVSASTYGIYSLQILPVLTSIEIINPGENYSTFDQITITNPKNVKMFAKIKEVDSDGGVVAVEIVEQGLGYPRSGNELLETLENTITVTFVTKSITAIGKAHLGAVFEYPGYYIGTDGFLDNVDKLRDDYFYQEFSYVVKSETNLVDWIGIVKKLVHPAGCLAWNAYQIAPPSIQVGAKNNTQHTPNFKLRHRDGPRHYTMSCQDIYAMDDREYYKRPTSNDVYVNSAANAKLQNVEFPNKRYWDSASQQIKQQRPIHSFFSRIVDDKKNLEGVQIGPTFRSINARDAFRYHPTQRFNNIIRENIFSSYISYQDYFSNYAHYSLEDLADIKLDDLLTNKRINLQPPAHHVLSYVTSKISGYITINGSGVPNVLVTLSTTGGEDDLTFEDDDGELLIEETGKLEQEIGNDVIEQVLTNGEGYYEFYVTNNDYVVTPELQGLLFTPPTISVTIFNNSVDHQDFTAIIASFNIIGTILEDGQPLSGATVDLTGAETRSTITNEFGAYIFAGLDPGQYTVTPSLIGHSFSPNHTDLQIISSDLDADFTSSLIIYTFNIWTKDLQYTALPNTDVIISGPGINETVQTDQNGQYTLEVPYPGGLYDIMAYKAGYLFDDPRYSHTYNINANGSGRYFYPIEFISGTISGLGGLIATVNLDSSNVPSIFTTTDINGYYEFKGIGDYTDVTYTITPDLIDYYFTPPNEQIAIDFDEVSNTYYTGQNFSGALIEYNADVYIWKYNSLGGGDNYPGVTVNLTGDAIDSGVTDADPGNPGHVRFSLINGSYRVTPETTERLFIPNFYDFNIFRQGAFLPFFSRGTIYGRVTDNGDGVPNVLVTCDDGINPIVSSYTDIYGYYNFEKIDYGTYTITPALNDYQFTPTDSQVTLTDTDWQTANSTNNDFTGQQLFSIGGTVTLDGGVRSGVTVYLTGYVTDSRITDANGSYLFDDLLADQTYTVTPDESGYIFVPSSTTINNLSQDEVVSFTESRIPIPSYLTNGTIYSWAQDTNNIYIGGRFTRVLADVAPSIIRMDPTTGIAGDNNIQNLMAGITGANGSGGDQGGPYVKKMIKQGNYLYVGGQFSSYQGTAVQSLVKIDLTTGLRDTTFDTTTGLGGSQSNMVTAMVLDAANNALYIGGEFTTYKGTTRQYIAKINATTAALDLTFDTTSGFSQGGPGDNYGSVSDIILDSPNNVLYVSGVFQKYKGISTRRFIKLDATTAARISAFDSQNNGPTNGMINSLAFDGIYLYIGGGFTTYNSTTRQGVARVNCTTAVLDPTFNSASGFSTTGTPVYSMALDVANNALYCAGTHTAYAGVPRGCVTKLNATTAALDVTFNPTVGFNGAPYGVLKIGNWLYLSGGFTTYNGTSCKYIAKINCNDSSLDQAFINSNPLDNWAYCLATYDNLLYVGGWFTTYAGVNRQGIAKFQKLGFALNTAFDFSSGFNSGSYVYSLLLNGNDLYAGGDFTSCGGTTRQRVAKINATTGMLDTSFDTTTGANSTVYGMALNSAATALYIGGLFTTYKAANRLYVAKISTAFATVDAAFVTNTGANSTVYSVALDGTETYLYIGGAFTTYKGTTRQYVAKVNATNSNLDATFNTTSGFDGIVYKLIVEGTDVYAGGAFGTYKGTSRPALAKLSTTDASLNGTFDSSAGFNNSIFSMWKTPGSNNLYVCGGPTGFGFTAYKGTTRQRVAKLNATTAALDMTFDTAVGCNSDAKGMILDGSVLYVGGAFSSYKSSTHVSGVRINSSTAAII